MVLLLTVADGTCRRPEAFLIHMGTERCVYLSVEYYATMAKVQQRVALLHLIVNYFLRTHCELLYLVYNHSLAKDWLLSN